MDVIGVCRNCGKPVERGRKVMISDNPRTFAVVCNIACRMAVKLKAFREVASAKAIATMEDDIKQLQGRIDAMQKDVDEITDDLKNVQNPDMVTNNLLVIEYRKADIILLLEEKVRKLDALKRLKEGADSIGADLAALRKILAVRRMYDR